MAAWMLTALLLSNPDTGVFKKTRHGIFLLQDLVAPRGITEWTTWLHALSSILIPSHCPPINLTDETSQCRQWCDVLLCRADLISRQLHHEILLFGVERIKTAVHKAVSGTEAGRRQEKMKILPCAKV